MTMTATYSPEDNKLRLYASSRLDNETFRRVRQAGFKWAPKQELFVAPRWTPSREDLLLELCGEIDDEDDSPEERAADRAERFSVYREKRRREATGHADTFEAGPSAFGHQDRRRAERQAARHDRHRVKAVSQWSKAEYWQMRTEGVIKHALHKSSAKVRRSRLLRLEAEHRKHQAAVETSTKRYNGWRTVLTLDGLDTPWSGTKVEGWIGIDPENETPAFLAAYALANTSLSGREFPHPRTGNLKTLFAHLMDEQDPMTPREAAELWLQTVRDPSDPESFDQRWCRHYELRLTYEKAMLEAEGGMAGDVEMEVGGFVGRYQIHKINKSPATGRVVSVNVADDDGQLHKICLERFGENVYRPPTEEERETFQKARAQAKAERKAKSPGRPKLINPTEEDAIRLQEHWNAKAKRRHEAANLHSAYQPSTVRRMTQAEYSAAARGTYSHLETVEVCEHGHRPKMQYGRNIDESPIAFKIRKCFPRGGWTTSADRVVLLTDKPQKPLPLDWDALEETPVEAGNLF